MEARLRALEQEVDSTCHRLLQQGRGDGLGGLGVGVGGRLQKSVGCMLATCHTSCTHTFPHTEMSPYRSRRPAALGHRLLRQPKRVTAATHMFAPTLSSHTYAPHLRVLLQEQETSNARSQAAAAAQKSDELQSSLALKQAEAASTLVAYTELHDQFTQLRHSHLALQVRGRL